MAWTECRNGSWRVAFPYKTGPSPFPIGEVSAADAAAHQASTEELLRLLKRNLISVPAGCSIEDFMFHRGKPPEYAATAAAEQKSLALSELWDVYLRSQETKLEGT